MPPEQMEGQRDHFCMGYDPFYIVHTSILPCTPSLEDKMTSALIPV